MKKIKLILMLIIASAMSLTIEAANARVAEHQLVNLSNKLAAPELEGLTWALMEFNSGWIVDSVNSEQVLPPASITKLMTNYVVFEKIKNKVVSLSDEILISEKSWRAEGSRMFAEVGSRITLEHLLKSTIIQSGNDAAIALAEHVAGSEQAFAEMMNQTAKRLGMSSANFMNSTGLPAQGHVMSARDILILSAAIIRDYPDFYAWYKLKEYKHNNIQQFNRNKLLWKDPMVDGLKTGHTEAAGFCLVGSSIKDGTRWLAVVMGAKSEKHREQSVMSLLRYAYAAYEPLEILTEQGGVASVKVYKGEAEQVSLQAQGAVHLVVPVGQADNLVVDYQLSPYYEAPIEMGQTMGIASVSLDGQLLMEVPLFSMSLIKQGGFLKRTVDALKLTYSDYTSEDK